MRNSSERLLSTAQLPEKLGNSHSSAATDPTALAHAIINTNHALAAMPKPFFGLPCMGLALSCRSTNRLPSTRERTISELPRRRSAKKSVAETGKVGQRRATVRDCGLNRRSGRGDVVGKTDAETNRQTPGT